MKPCGSLVRLGRHDADQMNSLASASDKVFDNFLSIVQRYDGEMIRAMSTAAHPIIQLVSDGADSGVVFQIETVTAEYIDVLARGSTEMQSLLSPL